jgi:endoglucanase
MKSRYLRGLLGKRFILTCIVVIAGLVAACHGSAAAAQGRGYWSTSGSGLVDSKGAAVRIAGINWYGFETATQVPHGLTNQDYRTILETIHTLGYNTIRLPFSNEMVEHPITPAAIGHSNASGNINVDLLGLNSLQVMDKIVGAAGTAGLKVILDNHRSEAGTSAESNGLWFTSKYPESSWIADWQTLVRRYSNYKDRAGNPTVIGVDLRNEPHNAAKGGACWTGDNTASGCAVVSAFNWPAAARRAASAIQKLNPKLLIFVEGTDEFDGDSYWWGGNLEGARVHPIQLVVPNKLVYSAHDYGPHESRQNWFDSKTTAATLEAVWTKYWAYLSLNGTAPVWVGEFGTTNSSIDVEDTTAGSQGQWFSSLVSFLANHPNLGSTYWALNGEDAYGLMDSSYSAAPASELKQQQLALLHTTLSADSAHGISTSAPPEPGNAPASTSRSNQPAKSHRRKQ